jgi:anti-sigma factor RsiW
MNEVVCRYPGDREQAIVAYVYGDIDSGELVRFDAHLPTCAQCRTEVSALTGVREEIGRWAPPEPASLLSNRQPPAASRRSWWRDVPAWAQVAAAALFLGVGAGLANIDVRHDASGWRIRSGWSKPVDAVASAPGASAVQAAEPAPTRAELTALEARLRAEIGRTNSTRVSNAANVATVANPANPENLGNPGNPELIRRVQALIDESERRQQRELALRVGEVLRDVNGQRQADLVQIERSLGAIQSNTGVEMMRQRETINNILVRTSLQK